MHIIFDVVRKQSVTDQLCPVASRKQNNNMTIVSADSDLRKVVREKIRKVEMQN